MPSVPPGGLRRARVPRVSVALPVVLLVAACALPALSLAAAGAVSRNQAVVAPVSSAAGTSGVAETGRRPLTRWRDDIGQDWLLPATLPSRWVVLGPHLVDMMIALGIESRIVAVQDDHPVPGRHRTSLSGYPVVGQAGTVNEERLRLLKPDLIVFWPTGLSAVQQERLRRQGIPLLAVEPARLQDISQRLRWLGALGGVGAHADNIAEGWQSQLRRTLAANAEGPRIRGFYQVWQTPLYSLAPEHLVSQAMRACGVDSIVTDTRMAAPVLSAESVLAAAPAVILVGRDQLAEARRFWGRFPSLPAVRDDGILPVPDRELTRPGLSLLEALPGLCDQLRPWRMRRSVPESA